MTDHHAIIPTQERAPADLPPDERVLYHLVCRRLLEAWHADHVFAVTTVTTEVASSGAVDRYLSTGTSIESVGWKVLEVQPRRRGSARDGAEKAEEPTLPGGLTPGLPRRVVDARAVTKTTRAPARYTDGTLLTAMETAGRSVAEEELSRAMRDSGLGTPATRAAILETLLKREYLVRDGKVLHATDKGIRLVQMVHAHVKSPAMTGEWEAKLARIERGEEEAPGFMRAIEEYVRGVVREVASMPAPRSSGSPLERRPPSGSPPERLHSPGPPSGRVHPPGPPPGKNSTPPGAPAGKNSTPPGAPAGKNSTPPAPRLCAARLHPPGPPPRLARRGERERVRTSHISRSPFLAWRGRGPGGRSS